MQIGSIGSLYNYSEYSFAKYRAPEGIIDNTGGSVGHDEKSNNQDQGMTPQLKEAIVRYRRANSNTDVGATLNAVKKQEGSEDIDRNDVERVLNERNLDDNKDTKKKVARLGQEDNRGEEGRVKAGEQQDRKVGIYNPLETKENQNNIVANLSQQSSEEGLNLKSRGKKIEDTEDMGLDSQGDRRVFKEKAEAMANEKNREKIVISREIDANKKDIITPEVEQEIVRMKKANPEASAQAIQKSVAQGEDKDISVADVRKVLQKNDLLNEDEKSEEEKKSEKMSTGELTPEEKQQVAELRQRDAEVKAHEMAHMSAGGQYVRGGASYSYQKGPDGKRYAVGGEVSIDSGAEGTPEKTIRKAQIVRSAALAPADPSPSDIKIAANASRMESAARAELAKEKAEEVKEVREEGMEKEAETAQVEEAKEGVNGEKAKEDEDSKVSPELEREIVNKKKTSPDLDATAIKQALTSEEKEDITEAEIKRILQKNNLLEGEDLNAEEVEGREESEINTEEETENIPQEEEEEEDEELPNVLKNILPGETEDTLVGQRKEEKREINALAGQKEESPEKERAGITNKERDKEAINKEGENSNQISLKRNVINNKINQYIRANWQNQQEKGSNFDFYAA